ncbi:MAG: hypothetical protein JOZ07_07905 [Solirubrobacterales bacterium]|nr:hypothetical protein [Solirubrobacterales bacterium]
MAPGDALGSIARKIGVPLARPTTLQPSAVTPPDGPQAGQRLRLRLRW